MRKIEKKFWAKFKNPRGKKDSPWAKTEDKHNIVPMTSSDIP